MNIAQIENNIKALVANYASGELASNDFIYELLLAYGHRNSTISMLKTGHYNIAKEPDEIIFKRHLYFKEIRGEGLHSEIDRMKNEKLVTANRTRFVIVTDFRNLLAVDTKTGDSLDIVLADLPKKFDFFLPWAGMEKAVYQGENPADVKAAEKMAKLFDLIKADNFTEETLGDKAALHNLNVFLTRLLFCFFAEDTEIFADNQFSNAIQAHTNEDGSDLAEYLNRLFSVLNTSGDERGVLPEYLANFPYVNGGLFADDILSPNFSRKSRRMLIECGSELNWSDINPDIFGSMIQAVVHPDQRSGMGMHYTSVTNIMKVIEPLFLNEIYEELDKGSNSATKLQKLQQRLGELKIFDPACGSGNFLIIAYKELRKLEIELLKRWQEIELEKSGQVFQPFSVIKLSQFYGIELDDFAHEVAILSLWLAEHQMNIEFKVEFGEILPSLPLRQSGNVISANALLIDWKSVCDPTDAEVYIIGNPPYLGAKNQSVQQKKEIRICLSSVTKAKNLDYIACWFINASKYISKNSKFAFVTTNSICQGTQVPLLWPHIFSLNLEIFFANKKFVWSNNARDKAGVTCSIIGVRHISDQSKYIYDNEIMRKVKNINAYLIDSKNVIVDKSSKSISKLPKMQNGNQPYDGGHLIFMDTEKNEFVAKDSRTETFFKKLVGSNEFIKGSFRWCLWIEDHEIDSALSIPLIKDRVDKVLNSRIKGGECAQSCADRPHQFRWVNRAKESQIVIPLVSSERREYIPIGFVDKEIIISNKAQIIFDPEPYVFGILCSRMHMVWVRAITGRIRSDYQYTAGLCYNSFPFPTIGVTEKENIFNASISIIELREKYSDRNLSSLYDPKKMPKDLLSAHENLDNVVESVYRGQQFYNDDERLEYLFNLYAKMTGGQNA